MHAPFLAPQPLAAGLVDALAHLDDGRIGDLPALLRRAADAGVQHMVSAGVNPLQARTPWMAQQQPVQVWRAVGLHPQAIDPSQVDAQLDAVLQQADDDHVVAIGEIGLDGRDGMPPDALQEHAFVTQLALAQARGLPVILHSVWRSGRMLTLLRQTGPLLCGGVLHNFSGPAEQVNAFAALGLSFSIGALVTQPNARRCREAAAVIPAERLLIESDAPESDPAQLGATLDALATLRGTAVATLAASTAAAARALYRLPTLTEMKMRNA